MKGQQRLRNTGFPARRLTTPSGLDVPAGSPPPSTLSVVLHLDKWYVYTHSVNGRTIYVGKGARGRGFDMARTSRSARYRKARGNTGVIEVSIVSWHETNAAALSAERALIKALKPPGNDQSNKAALLERGKAAEEKSRAISQAFKDKYKDMHL
jgi:hypothetical protein